MEEKKISKPYSMEPSTVKWVDQYAAKLTIETGERVSASQIVRDALALYRAAQEADGVVKLAKNGKARK